MSHARVALVSSVTSSISAASSMFGISSSAQMNYRNCLKFDSAGRFLVSIVIGIGCVGSLVAGCAGVDLDPFELVSEESEEPFVPDVGLSDAVDRAVSRYNESPDVETCSQLAEWYVNGLEVAFEGELVGLIENDPSIDTAYQVIPSVSRALIDTMVGSLKRNDSLCSRNQGLSIDSIVDSIVSPELKPQTQKALYLLAQHGGYTSLEGSVGVKIAIDIVENRPLHFEINVFSDDQQE